MVGELIEEEGNEKEAIRATHPKGETCSVADLGTELKFGTRALPLTSFDQERNYLFSVLLRMS